MLHFAQHDVWFVWVMPMQGNVFVLRMKERGVTVK
jgi:hypothetical protein